MRQVLHIFDQTPNRRVSEGYEYQNPTRQRGNQNPTRQRGNQNPTRQRGNQNPKRQRGPGGTRDAAAASFLAYALRVTMGLVSSLTLRVTMGLVSSLTLRVTMPVHASLTHPVFGTGPHGCRARLLRGLARRTGSECCRARPTNSFAWHRIVASGIWLSKPSSRCVSFSDVCPRRKQRHARDSIGN